LTIRDPQLFDNARPFAMNFGERLRQEGSAASVEKVRSVPASGLRAWSYRTFAQLGTAAHQRPWVGLPALGLFALPLALLTLAANVFAAARTHAAPNGGTTSSLLVVVRVGKQ
jgi:hypothetical protein